MLSLYKHVYCYSIVNYKDREAPRLKIHSVCLFVCLLVCLLFCVFFFVFSFTDFSFWTLIGSRPDDTFFVVSRTVLEQEEY